MGLSQPYVGQLENGLRAGDVATVEKLARLLKLRMEDLVTATPA
jgi:transcriptional regulator with XRE-family HTH domain